MPNKLKIGILGIGGVGGFFGGLLAEKYSKSNIAEIIFITRPSSENVIKDTGLKLITDSGERIIFPDIITSDPNSLEVLDIIICTVKSYDLVSSLASLKNCVNDKSIFLPLLNGVDAKDEIEEIFPDNVVLEGCVYIVSRLQEPGVVKVSGQIHSLFFGSDKLPLQKLQQINQLLREAGIESFLAEDITKTIWEKFIFISSIASLTSYLNLTIGAILQDKNHEAMLVKLLSEIKNIAVAKKINLPEDIIDRSLSKMKKLPFETTSSMHSDFLKGGKTEYLSLTGYIVNLGKELNIETPSYNNIFQELEKRNIEGYLKSTQVKF